MTEEKHCVICKSQIEPENNTNICFSCHNIITEIQTKVDALGNHTEK